MSKLKKLKDYTGDSRNINQFVLYMPKRIFDTMDGTGLNTQRVIFRSPFSSQNGFWVRVEPKHADRTGLDRNRMFPVCNIPASIVLEWRVIKILNP